MDQAAFAGEGEEREFAAFGLADGLEAVVFGGVAEADGGEGDESAGLDGHDFHEGEVIELGEEAGLDADAAEPGFDGAAKGGAFGGEERGGVVEGLGEAAPKFAGERGGGAEGGAAFAEGMGEDFEVGAAGGGFVGQDKVEAMGGELGEEVFELAFAADHANGLGRGKSRGENVVGNVLGEGIDDADVEAEAAGAGALFDGAEHFLAEGEDFLGVAEDDLAGFGEAIFAAFLAEEPFAEGRFEFADLLGDGGLGDAEAGGGGGEAPFAGSGPEIAKMVVIDPIHADFDTSEIPKYQFGTS